ncbi:hydroxymethylglutaryl-CoA lyase [Sphingobacterium sp. HJSM2_6]|uniref:hydroxymethylglutaryl-CoA lyase n=1 Tax=Sphingobacterium sp. HJSM2_6 TaxID=3366264 RepID=UPI003BE8AABA
MSNNSEIKIIDCPRDALQGIKTWLPTENKIAYINQLIASGLFSTIDFGSFVSPHAVPQMKDSGEVLEGLIKRDGVELSAVIANKRGLDIAVTYDSLDRVGFPFSISETFQQRNTNKGIVEAVETLNYILEVLSTRNKLHLVVYISMAFGNPYEDPWSYDLVLSWIHQLKNMGVNRFSIADTTSEANPTQINELFRRIHQDFPTLDVSAHFHSSAAMALSKIEAAYDAGCRSFEGAILGYGGCPFAQDELVGNISSELLLKHFNLADDAETGPLVKEFQKLISHAV